MIHASIIDGIPEESRGELTHALMGTTAPPVVPKRLEGARMPPVGVPVRTLPGMPVGEAIKQITGVMPRGAGR